jgi:hypothetical protein
MIRIGLMKFRRLAVVLLASLALAACSDDSDSNNSTNNGTADAERGDVSDDASSDAGQDAATNDGGDQSDADQRDTDQGDADQRDADQGDADQADTGQDTSDAGGAVCGDGDDNDCDYDGLLDCEEEQIGTDPCNHDTDGDNLNDMQELLSGTDPLVADSDGDGLDDGEEVDLGLDPTRTVSYNDGIADNERWIVTACEEPSGEPVDYYTSQNVQVDPNSPTQINVGNWLLALPPAFSNQTELDVSGLTVTSGSIDDRKAATVYDDPSNEVAGFLLSYTPGSGQNSATDVINNLRTTVAGEGTIAQGYNGGEFDTHDFRKAVIGRYLLNTSTRNYKDLRDELLFGMAPFGPSDVSGLPATSGAQYASFRVFVSAIYRKFNSGERQVLVSVAIAPADKYESREKVQFRMDDLTNTTNIAESVDGHYVRCNIFAPKENSKADFYWVLDASGSMNDDYNRVQAVANGFYNELNNTGLDYRLGVANTEQSDQGRLRAGVGWHTDLNTFLAEITYITSIGGYAEYGLQVAEEGIAYMKGITGTPPQNHRIRPDAQLITIWMSDEEEENIQRDPLTGAAGQQLLQSWINFFKQHTVGFSIVGDGNGCGVHDGRAYKEVALATGGSHASLCATDISETIEDIIFAATGYAGYQMPDTPISSTLRVFINGQYVPRSRQNGFDYFAQTNSIAFFGTYRPEIGTGTTPPDNISITYETFLDRSKD